MEYLGLLLTSSVVVALITYQQVKRSQKLTHVTEERRKWREELRVIAENLEVSSDVNQVKMELARLKVRINTINKYKEGTIDYLIWKKIKEIDSDLQPDIGMKKTHASKIKILTLFISALLKEDWERSKVEVVGSLINAVYYATNITAVLSLIVGGVMCLESVLKFENQIGLAGIFIILVLLLSIEPISTRFFSITAKVNEKITSKIEVVLAQIFILVILIISMFNLLGKNSYGNITLGLTILVLSFLMGKLSDVIKSGNDKRKNNQEFIKKLETE